MKDEEIRRYANLMEELDLERLTVTEKGISVTLERPRGTVPTPQQGKNAAHKEAGEQEDGIVSITSPMVGVFYAAPAENAAPFISTGDAVSEGDVLCIIEAMKLMNEIRAEESGTIEKICVTNGQVVEFGTELMRIRRQ